jgi:phosphoglycerol transferase MdoB-like AlkP superfamily enzyme
MTTPTSFLVLYMLNIIITAVPFSCAGSLIPFMAADLDIDETEYAPMFTYISLGCFSSAIIFKVFNSCQLLPRHHTTIAICISEIAIFSVVMLFAKTRTSQIIVITIIDIFAYVLQIATFICVVIAPSKEQISLWIAFTQAAYGLGSLIASMLTGFLSYHIFTFLAILCVIAIPICFILPSPDGDGAQLD